MGMYKTYLCKVCKKTCILLKEEISKKGYLKCPHCSSRKIVPANETDNLKECMNERHYKRQKGYIRQVE